MKILQVSHGFPPAKNAGVELYTFYLSKELYRLNHSVHVFCREEDPGKEEFSSFEEEMEGLRVTRVVNNLTWVTTPRGFYDHHFFDEIFSRILKQEKPDLVHFQHFIALSGHLLRIAKEEGCPVVLTLHDFFILCHRIQLLKGDNRLCSGPLFGLECASCVDPIPPSWNSRTKFLLKMKDVLPFPVIRRVQRFFIPSKFLGHQGYEAFHRYRFMYEILKIPDIVLVPSLFVRELFLKYYPFLRSRIQVLPLGIPPIVGPVSPRERGKRMRFCYFGNIFPFKGLHVLIDAFKNLPQGRATLTIYGSGTSWTRSYDEQLKDQARGYSVDFRGPFKREHLSEALNDQDVVVLPSLCPESFSLVIREANALGLPVIASRIGAIPEAVKDGVNGVLFEPGDVEALTHRMRRFVDEPHLIEKMASSMPRVHWMSDHALELTRIYQEINGKG